MSAPAMRPPARRVVPPQSTPFPQTHPDNLATIATLFGLSPTPITRCRVLELGCGAGGNLLPMAAALPESHFVGVEPTERECGEAVEVVRALGLKNVEMKQLSIADIDDGLGKFDYIVAHGVYSRVADAVQDRILDVCRRNLAPNGIAYVSYNVYPGWRVRGAIREMMQYHAGTVRDPKARVEQARAMLDFLGKSTAKDASPYGQLLKQEVELLGRQADSYLFHELLEDGNEPLYFHQFEQRLRNRSLRYLGEADFRVMLPQHLPQEAQEALQRVAPDLVHLEQYMDLLRNRSFRQTLFCHAEQRPNYAIGVEAVSKLRVAAQALPASKEPDVLGTTQETFKVGEVGINSPDPLVKAAVLHLSQLWPHSVPFDELVRVARERVAGTAAAARPAEDDTKSLAQMLMSTYAATGKTLLQLTTWQPPVVRAAGPRPEVSPLARLQVLKGNLPTTVSHQVLLLGDLDRQLLPLLDGSRERPALASALVDQVNRGVLNVQAEGKKVTDANVVRQAMELAVDQALARYARAALLVA